MTRPKQNPALVHVDPVNRFERDQEHAAGLLRRVQHQQPGQREHRSQIAEPSFAAVHAVSTTGTCRSVCVDVWARSLVARCNRHSWDGVCFHTTSVASLCPLGHRATTAFRPDRPGIHAYRAAPVVACVKWGPPRSDVLSLSRYVRGMTQRMNRFVTAPTRGSGRGVKLAPISPGGGSR